MQSRSSERDNVADVSENGVASMRCPQGDRTTQWRDGGMEGVCGDR